MNFHQKKEYLARLKQRAALLLLPATCALLTANLTAMEESITPDSEKELTEIIRAARAGDQQQASALAEIRIFTADNFLVANSNPMSFFEEVSLGDSDEPFIQNTSRWNINVDYIGQDGRAKKTQGLKYQDQSRVELTTISTDEFEYFLKDIYTGDVKTPSLATVDMARAVTLKTNRLLWPFVKSRIGAFNLTGKQTSRVYVPELNSGIVTANLPATNLLTPSDNTGTSLWRKSCMDEVIQYIASWGTNAFSDGEFSKRVVVYLPSSHVTGFLKEITLTSQPNSRVETIFDNAGIELDYGGFHWVLMGDTSLDPADKTAYVSLGKGIGMFFTKPGMDETYVDESITMRKQNRGSVSMSKVIGFGLPSNRVMNMCAVRYRS